MNKMLARALTLLMCSLALPSLADEGRIPVHTAPTVITESGKYVLTRNLSPVAGNPGIKIVAPVVDLDLNGFTVDTTGVGQPAIYIDQFSEVVIHNGTLLGGGIESANAGEKRIVIEDMQIRDVFARGIDLNFVVHVTLRRNVIINAAQEGILVGGAVPFTGTIEDNVLREIGYAGIYLSSGWNLGVRRNQLYNIGAGLVSPGIHVGSAIGSRVEQNMLYEVNGIGIRMVGGRNVVFSGNVIHEAADDGFYADANVESASFIGNQIARCSGNGIHLDGADYSVLRDNNMIYNTDVGLRIAAGSGLSVYSGNVALVNCLGGGMCACLPAAVTNFCDEGAGSIDGGGNVMP